MSAGLQCDTCRKFAPQGAPGWFYVAQQPDESAAYSLMSAMLGRPAEPLTFCRARCLAEWAYVRAMASEAPAGDEPAARGGTGWPK